MRGQHVNWDSYLDTRFSKELHRSGQAQPSLLCCTSTAEARTCHALKTNAPGPNQEGSLPACSSHPTDLV